VVGSAQGDGCCDQTQQRRRVGRSRAHTSTLPGGDGQWTVVGENSQAQAPGGQQGPSQARLRVSLTARPGS